MMKAYERQQRVVAAAKSARTRAKRGPFSLSGLVALNRRIELEQARERVLYQYQHSLEDEGIEDPAEALAWLETKGVDLPQLREGNPIASMPGGSVSGCIAKMKRERKDIDEPGAYCAAIADRIEPGWRTKKNRGRTKKFREQIPGGEAAGKRPEDFDPIQLHRGMRVELEHTDDRMLATEIAMDHLAEDPDYYEKLATIHNPARKLKNRLMR